MHRVVMGHADTVAAFPLRKKARSVGSFGVKKSPNQAPPARPARAAACMAASSTSRSDGRSVKMNPLPYLPLAVYRILLEHIFQEPVDMRKFTVRITDLPLLGTLLNFTTMAPGASVATARPTPRGNLNAAGKWYGAALVAWMSDKFEAR
ncbi:hypothetical protein T492DRAFT_891863 [Pavlovales sp. CCMP2436]|nr:hypothetical protein T492DRAFT_891863 [Pavlovales sp. CCMP2436]